MRELAREIWWDLTIYYHIFNPGTSHLITIDNWCLFMVGWVWWNSQGSPLEPLAARVLGTVSPRCDLQTGSARVNPPFFVDDLLILAGSHPLFSWDFHVGSSWPTNCPYPGTESSKVRWLLQVPIVPKGGSEQQYWQLSWHATPFLFSHLAASNKPQVPSAKPVAGVVYGKGSFAADIFHGQSLRVLAKKCELLADDADFPFIAVPPASELSRKSWARETMGFSNGKNANFAGGQVVTLWPWQVMGRLWGTFSSGCISKISSIKSSRDEDQL